MSNLKDTGLIKNTFAWIGEHFPVTMVKLRYLERFHRMPDLSNPKDLNEKILWLKLYSNTSEWTRLADKIRVRDYVRECGLEHTLIPLYGAWERVEDIPFDDLPQRFMLKANNGDGKGTNIKIDKALMLDEDWRIVKKRLREWLSARHIGALSAEPQYRGIRPMILAEEMLPVEEGASSLVDYKLWCFNGKPYSFFVCSNRQDNGYEASVGCYDLDWNFFPENMQDTGHMKVTSEPLPRPQHLEEMISVAQKLAGEFPEVRVDLYEADGRVWFGELTFTSLGGMMNYYSDGYLRKMGNQVDLSAVRKNL